MDSHDLDFSLTDNWCVVWDPPLVVQLCCSSHRCPTSHRRRDIVEDTSVHPSDRRLTTLRHLGSRASRDTGLRYSWDPPYAGPSLLAVKLHPRTSRYNIIKLISPTNLLKFIIKFIKPPGNNYITCKLF